MNWIKLLSFFLIVSMMSSCARHPVTGKRRLSFMSEKKEIAMGKQYDPQVTAQFGLYDDKKMQAFITRKGQEMARISHRSHLDFSFKVVDSPVINAFAVPGGYIYFTRGIMAHFNNEAQFAGVLGHEIGHISHQHASEQMTKQTLGQILYIGGLILSPEFRQFSQEAGQAMGLLFLSFSRSNERESDVLGVEYSSKVGYDSHEMAKFFRTLQRQSEGTEGGRIPEFMSTHPDPGSRFEKVNELTDKWQAENNARNLKVGRDSYLDLIDGMVYGEDPRQGYVVDNTFYHPDLKFSYNTPQGWQVINAPTQVQMAPSDGKALMVFTLTQQTSFEAAKQEAIEQHQLTPIRDLNFEVNGLPAYGMVSDQKQTNQNNQEVVVSIQTVFIKYDNKMYVFHGLCSKNEFNRYERLFDNTMNSFKKLTDPNRLNVTPHRLDIVKAKQAGTYTQAFNSYNMPSSIHRKLAILNGVELTDRLKVGERFKVIEKGRNFEF